MNNKALHNEISRNTNPTPAAIFAIHLWHDRFMVCGKRGIMSFWDSLTRSEKAYCNRAVLDIKKAFKKF